jgi:hypothetical protein
MKRTGNKRFGTVLTAACAVGLALNLQAANLPSKVCFSITPESGFGLPSYQDLTMDVSGQTQMFDSWCISPNVHINGSFAYTALVLTPAEASTLVAHPENFDLVAYLLNQNYQGKTSPSGGTYTFGDVQVAIWTLLNDAIGDDMGPWDPARVNEIITAAATNGEGFVPGCGQNQLVVLEPVLEGCDLSTTSTTPVTQLLLIGVPAQCGPGTGTPGYWANHPKAWPVQEIQVGGITYSKQQAISMLLQPKAGDKRGTLFAALVCAKLNILIENDGSCVQDVIASADAWWATYYGSKVAGSSAAWQTAEPWYFTLDQYNNGLLCAPHRQ